jgi:hypothetical protein
MTLPVFWTRSCVLVDEHLASAQAQQFLVSDPWKQLQTALKRGIQDERKNLPWIQW